MFLKNAWYVAARSEEVNRGLLKRTMLKEDIVLYRTEAGLPVALENACPHRKLPLSMGCLKGDAVECGYHGLMFDPSGKCVAAPTQERIPPSARVKSYPAEERYGLVWVWMGDPAQADASSIYQVENYGKAGWGRTDGGVLDIKCHYLYITDNLLDPSHVAWVHKTSFFAPGTEGTPLETDLYEDGLVVSRWIYNQTPPDFYAPLLKFKGNCDRLQHYEVRTPSIAVNKSIFTPPGGGGDVNNLPEQSYVMVSYNFMTPVDENHTRYYWFQHRNTDPDDEALSARIHTGAVMAFNEDRVVLEAVHRGMAEKTTDNFNLGLDAGALRFRMLLDKMIDAECSAASPAPARRA